MSGRSAGCRPGDDEEHLEIRDAALAYPRRELVPGQVRFVIWREGHDIAGLVGDEAAGIMFPAGTTFRVARIIGAPGGPREIHLDWPSRDLDDAALAERAQSWLRLNADGGPP
jgi:hypothetical protein